MGHRWTYSSLVSVSPLAGKLHDGREFLFFHSVCPVPSTVPGTLDAQ